MKARDASKFWKNAAAGIAVFVAVGSLTYLGLDEGGKSGISGSAATSSGKEAATSGVSASGQEAGSAGERQAVAQNGDKVGAGSRTLSLLVPKAPVEGQPLVAAGMNPDSDKGRVVRLRAADFKKWGAVVQNEKISLPTPDGGELLGTVNLVSADSGWFRMGGTLDGENGGFQMSARAEEVVGGIYRPAMGIGYQIQMDGSDVVLVERRLSALMCYSAGMPGIAAAGRVASGEVARASGPQVIPEINTRPGAMGVIYVDFAGGLIKSTAWKTPIEASPSVLSGESINQVLARAAEDFAPLDVTLTTIRAVHDATPVGRRMRVVVTPTKTAGPGSGGVAYINSWQWKQEDIVCWVFNEGVKSCADTIAHEVGHTLGLDHHGTKSGNEYYSGHGGGLTVPTSWGPIMGAPFDVNLTQWSKGQYYDADRSTQDDLHIITKDLQNGFSYVNSPGANGVVRSLPLVGSMFQTSGTLVSQTDSHVYQFSTVGGRLSASVRPQSSVGTGDFRLDLLDSGGASLVVADSEDSLGAGISQVLVPGVYRLRVAPTGTGAMPPNGYKTGYSAYGSLGGYLMTGMVEGATSFPAFLNSKLLTGTEGQFFSEKFAVTDPSKTTVTKLAEKLPPGLTFDAGSLLLSGTAQAGTAGGVWSLSLLAKNSFGETRVEFKLVISQQSEGLTSAFGTSVAGLTTSPNAPWIGVYKTLASGTSGIVAQSGPVADKGSSAVGFTYTAPALPVSGGSRPPTVMTFYWRSDTENGKDVVQCKVDGAQAKDMVSGKPLVLSGSSNWVKQTVLLPAMGTRKVEFVYTKDANLSSGADRVWVYGVEIGQPPMITASPLPSVRVTPGTVASSGTFSLKAGALGATSVAWWKNGVALANGTSAGGSSLEGVNTGTLTVRGAKAADAGVYWMVARNSWGAAASNRAEVVVSVPPVVTMPPVDQIGLKVGDPLILTAKVSGAQPIFYQWKKDGVGGRWSGTPSLTISKTTVANAGKYVLVAVSPSGTVTSKEVTVSFAGVPVKTAGASR